MRSNKMVRKLERFPNVGEMVVCQVKQVEKMYIYCVLEDYKGNDDVKGNARGMIHISELANRWIRNVSNYVKEGQRVVLKVLRVNPEKGHIDLSLRRVNESQKAVTMNQWKYEVKAENLFRIFGEQTKLTLDDVYEKIGFPLTEYYGDIHSAFDALKEHGITELDETEIDKDYKQEFFDLMDANIQLSIVEVSGELEIIVFKGDGIETIKKAIKTAQALNKKKFVEVKFHYIGAPYYLLKITAQNYPDAEGLLKKILKSLEKGIKKAGGVVSFERAGKT